ncbi:50S ribosomal protein L4 [Buchnera aphidicola (Ceratoglyphina bambusae)]|uniref:50S ribosomal protein L4 n=1 Tax=Buchnera aphidicola TaxID=9 RepID=UPI0031B7EC35
MKLVLKDDKSNFIDVSDALFNKSFNKILIHQVLVSYMSRNRKGTKSQKSKSEVSGSGKKPWKQKGTGRARVGSIRSPLWRSGGVTFAYKKKNYFKKINKKMYKSAIRSIFSELIRKNKLLIFNTFDIELPKTKLLINKLKFIKFNKILIILDNFNKNVFLAARNTKQINVIENRFINPLILVSYEKIIITVNAFKKIENSLYEISRKNF